MWMVVVLDGGMVCFSPAEGAWSRAEANLGGSALDAFSESKRQGSLIVYNIWKDESGEGATVRQSSKKTQP